MVRSFKSFFIILLAGAIIAARLIQLEVPVDQIYYFSGYYCFAVMVFAISILRFGDFINPLSVYSIFIFLLSYSFVRFANTQSEYYFKTRLILNLSILTYVCFALVDYKVVPVAVMRFTSRVRRNILTGVVVAAFCTFLAECALFGYIPILNITSQDVYIETNAKLIPFLHYFIVLCAFVPTWGYLLYKQGDMSKKRMYLLNAVTFFILLNYLSRQLYLLGGICFLLAYMFYNRVNFRKLLRTGIAIVFMFLFMGYLKFNSDTTDSFSHFMRLVAGIDNENVSLVESTFTEYSSKRFTALDNMVIYKDNNNYTGYGIYTFRPLLSLFLLEKTGVIEKKEELDSEKNVGTYVIDPYLDYGLLGTVILNALYAFLSVRYYKQYKGKYSEGVVKFGIIMFCLIMGMFVNYFNTMLIWMGFVFNKFIIYGKVEAEPN
ncbi:oligosaccharide repeat unit polymerase [Filimonas lacunae]|uniref:Oligosaccharide repeat unit polymerase n=2 Tax=Filimonas lacunae TaxID=477680 RepID=A0A173MRB8_9BACT|nr:hypothetical protein FLA_6264 [Filimonas lacunae]SIT18294.1 oligosaccharide repeat unit polymerase [Filimonas lacunae]